MANVDGIKPTHLRLVEGPYVTIKRSGAIALNLTAYQELGRPQSVELVYDQRSRVIGIHPVDKAFAHCVYVRRASMSLNGPFVLSARAFLDHYGLFGGSTEKWSADMVDGVLCVNLDDLAIPVTSRPATRWPSLPVTGDRDL
jgi:hypothetical protein